MRNIFLFPLAGVLLLSGVTSAASHHSILGKFDDAKPVTLQGVVTMVHWADPHAHIFLNVSDETGNVRNWVVELESKVDLRRDGWTEDSLPAGEVVRVEGIAARDGQDQAWAYSVVITRTGASVYTSSGPGAPETAASARPTPRRPNGRPRLGPVPGESGYWAHPSASSLAETGVEVPWGAAGLLEDLADAAKVAPFQPWALQLYIERQRNFLKDDPMFLGCIPPGGPRQFQVPYGLQFIEEPERERVFVLQGGGNRNWRLIYTDGRDHGSVEGNLDNPLFFGSSVAYWEGDTFVVDTRNFNEKFWFSNGGLPHTDRLRLVERISRPDHDTLRYEVTIDDPAAYTRSWTSSWTLRWVADQEMPEYFCQDNRP